jgi:hypothetical protein
LVVVVSTSYKALIPITLKNHLPPNCRSIYKVHLFFPLQMQITDIFHKSDIKEKKRNVKEALMLIRIYVCFMSHHIYLLFGALGVFIITGYNKLVAMPQPMPNQTQDHVHNFQM